jgi:hypothetical protein
LDKKWRCLPGVGLILTGGKVLFRFDLDLVEPSLSAWKEISPQLCSGDLLYFDQASKSEDQKILFDEYLLKEKK